MIQSAKEYFKITKPIICKYKDQWYYKRTANLFGLKIPVPNNFSIRIRYGYYTNRNDVVIPTNGTVDIDKLFTDDISEIVIENHRKPTLESKEQQQQISDDPNALEYMLCTCDTMFEFKTDSITFYFGNTKGNNTWWVDRTLTMRDVLDRYGCLPKLTFLSTLAYWSSIRGEDVESITQYIKETYPEYTDNCKWITEAYNYGKN